MTTLFSQEKVWEIERFNIARESKAEILRTAIKNSGLQAVAKLFGLSESELMKQAYPEGHSAQ